VRLKLRTTIGARVVALGLLVGMGGSALAQTDTRIAAVLKRQDATAARALIRQKADVNAADAEGMAPLHWAAHWNDLETVRALLAAGARPDAANRYGVTPLHEAATLGNAAMAGALLRAGADVNAAYGEGETPLMIAARTGSPETVRLLLESGAAVNAAERWRGQTPIMFAAVENHAAIVKALVDAGADVNARGVAHTFQKLTGGAGGIIHDRPEGGLTALILAARQGARESGEVLVAAGADLDASEPQYGFTALQTAIFNGKYRFAQMLIEKGANLNDGSLYIAVEMRNLATYSNRPNPPDSDGGVTHLDVIRTLLEKGADPDAPYTKSIPPRQAQGNINVPPGATPLYRAVRSVDLATVRLLLDRGANPSKALADGSTPLMAAAGLGAPRGGDEEVTDAGDRNDPVDVLKALVAKGANVNAANDLGMTPLHYAVQRGHERIIEYLAAAGARFDAANKQGRTPVELAKSRTAALVAKLTGAAAQDGQRR
jgi:ankyrin repeat protein